MIMDVQTVGLANIKYNNVSRFWAVEGIDGSGKGTMVMHISDVLATKGIDHVVVAAYPSGDEAKFMRDAWINQRIPMPAVLSCILYLRRRVLIEEIIPALLAGKVVISDRWNDTTWVYQHYTQGIPKKMMDAMFDYHLNIPNILAQFPQDKRAWLYKQIQEYVAIYLDIDVATSRARVNARTDITSVAKDAFETKPDEFFQNLIQNFSLQWKNRSFLEMGPLFSIDATRSLDDVKASVGRVIDMLV